MSEYQYYEWLAVDRPLSDQEQTAVGGLSSHIEVEPTGAWVEYNWSSFRHNPRDVLARYFDAFLYMANWGTRQLMFRFPKSLLDKRVIQPYCLEDGVDLAAAGDDWILSFGLDAEQGSGEWDGDTNWLSALAPLRNDLLLGDTRSLYVGWLAQVEGGYLLEEDLEPPLPPGLGQLTGPLKKLMRFLEIDDQLLKVAAAASAAPAVIPNDVLRAALSRLPRSECDDLLWRLVQGERNLDATLLRRLHELAGGMAAPVEPPRRSVGELLAARDRLAQARQRAQATAAKAGRIKDLEALAPREAEVWLTVDQLIATYQPKAYKDAVAHLVHLRDLAEYKGSQATFQARLRQIREQYARRSSLMAALQAAGLA